MTDASVARPENSHIWQREEHEHYVEPEWCSKRLFEVEQFGDVIFDPCCGFGHILKSAAARGHEVWGNDIVDRGWSGTKVEDFLKRKNFVEADIVCNPPFDVFESFAKQAKTSERQGRDDLACSYITGRSVAARNASLKNPCLSGFLPQELNHETHSIALAYHLGA